MSLKKLKSSPKLVSEGRWFDVTTNSDGSKCRVKLRRSGQANPKWLVAMREHTAGIDTDNLSPEEDAKLMASVFAEACVADWDNLQPEDDGNNVPFSVAAAVEFVTNPEWVDLLADWRDKASSAPNFRASREVEAGN